MHADKKQLLLSLQTENKLKQYKKLNISKTIPSGNILDTYPNLFIRK